MKLRSCARLLGLAAWTGSVCVAEGDSKTVHEKGRCSMRGHCNKSFFGAAQPCVDNSEAAKPDKDLRDKLVDVCGDKWADTNVCCDAEQVDSLNTNLQRAETFIASCPACRQNFYNLFCTFTCSPDQSLFVNVTDSAKDSNDKVYVEELDNLWSEDYKTGFYDSCKEVKFGATNTPAMSFIGGGATNASQFLSFLGKKNPPLGSPFQIDFPNTSQSDFPGLVPMVQQSHACNSTSDKYRCSCVDCPPSCPELAPLDTANGCRVGVLPCLSFAIIITYTLSLLLLVTAIAGHVAYRKHSQRKNERLRLLQDTEMSDDEDDESDRIYRVPAPSRPTRKYFINTFCDRVFNKLGRTCATFPAITIGTSISFVFLLSLGWLNFAIERDPVRLWVAPNSDAANEKAFFDEKFGPFFRAEQVFLVNDMDSESDNSIFGYDNLNWWFHVESKARKMKSWTNNVTLDDICYKPTGEACVVQSLSGYFQDGLNSDTWWEDLQNCLSNPADTECLPDFGLPLNPKLVLGGWEDDPREAKAMVVTWVVNNDVEGTVQLAQAMEWEAMMKAFLLNDVKPQAEERGLRLSFTTESSLEEELNDTSNTDANIVIVSYVIMFLYASLALGSTTLAVRQVLRKPATALVQSKFMLGVVGIVIVLLSVSASVGLFSACGVKVTLIIAEVIPFLVLAIGVDNIFLIVHEFERVNISHPDDQVEERIARALGRMGPSILLSGSMEAIAFALGAFVGMPAVRNFAIYAAGAVVINALLQVTMFVSALALNQRRVEAGRADCVPCVQVRPAVGLYEDDVPEDGGLQRFIRRKYAPALLGNRTKVAVTTLFFGLFAAGLALLPAVKLGLDQRIAIPSGSYLISYFNDLSEYFDSGPPVYFVVRDLNVTQRQHQQQLCGRFSTCDEYSLANLLEQERKRPEVSYIADSAANWVDDFFLWLNPSLDSCCVDPSTGSPCFADRVPTWNITLYGMPEGQEYMSYLRHWLSAPTDAECPLGGKAAYSTAVVLPKSETDTDNDTPTSKQLTIPASHFRTSHTALRTQSDFISAYASARRIAADIQSHNPGVSVFPYSKFYIFFDQYASIVRLTILLLGCAIAACFLVCTILLGSVRTALVVALTVTMTLVDIGGAMALANVSLNAVTLVNLVICVGIAVEFCAHIARAFQFPAQRFLHDAVLASGPAAPSRAPLFLRPQGGPSNKSARNGGRGAGIVGLVAGGSAATNTAATQQRSSLRARNTRAWAALSQVGASVFSGITVTKLLGVCVLAFTRSKIFEVYYFRVWLALIVLAALHALVFLPVALSWFGGAEGYASAEEGTAGGGVEEDLRGRMGVRGADGTYWDVEDSDEED
ncbi:MAG: hypothetical protein M1831_003685 [Alyxoria varia]|nr:MAG: hypothetical protein M1831_003685 [Alyxoria varia]